MDEETKKMIKRIDQNFPIVHKIHTLVWVVVVLCLVTIISVFLTSHWSSSNEEKIMAKVGKVEEIAKFVNKNEKRYTKIAKETGDFINNYKKDKEAIEAEKEKVEEMNTWIELRKSEISGDKEKLEKLLTDVAFLKRYKLKELRAKKVAEEEKKAAEEEAKAETEAEAPEMEPLPDEAKVGEEVAEEKTEEEPSESKMDNEGKTPAVSETEKTLKAIPEKTAAGIPLSDIAEIAVYTKPVEQ